MTESTQPGARERVFAACQALAETGERITVAAVRRAAAVSMQEASDGVRAWRQTQAQVQSVPEPPEAVAAALRGVWGAALSTARTEAEHAAAQARAAQTQAEAEAAELLVAVTEAETA
uniref:DNA-binding protein n=1 Tax=Kocuria marina TaxID=223184 RepID=UPI0022E2097F